MMPGASTLFWKSEPLAAAHLTALREAGMECVELADYHPNWSYLKASWLRGLRADLAGAGLIANSVHTHMAWYDPELVLSHPEPTRCQRAVESYLRAVDALALLDCRILLTHDIAIPEQDTPEHHDRREAFVESLARVAEYAATAGIAVAIENTTSGYGADTARVTALAAATGCANVGVCVDTGHANLFSPAEAHVRAAGPRLITLQVDDSSDHANQHTLPGRGTTNWPALIEALRDVRYGGRFVYELTRPEDVPELRANYEWLMRLVPAR